MTTLVTTPTLPTMPTPATPLTVPIDHETANAARRLALILGTPGAADLMAGGRVSVDTLERIHVAVAALFYHTAELGELARGARQPIGPGSAEYTFDVLTHGGDVAGGLAVRWFADDPAGARAMAFTAFAHDNRFDAETMTLSRVPRIRE